MLTLMIAAATSRPKLTLDEWASLPEDEPGELVDGELVEEELPSFVHEVVVVWLAAILRGWAAGRGGFVTGSGLKLKVSGRRGRMADVIVYFRRGKVQAHGIVTVPPDVAIEVISSDPKDQKRDRIDKLDEYAAFGVRFYWLVSPDLRTIEILELGGDGRYVHAQNLAAGTASIVGCDGLTLDLDDLWREVVRAENEEPV
jgi:Uma2 family endonuclease